MNALEVIGLRKAFVVERTALGRPARIVEAVRGLDFSITRGSTLGLVGESGAGKSTVGRLVLRLIDPDAGQIRLLGEDLMSMGSGELRRARARATMIFQDPFKSLNPRLSVRTSIEEPLRAQGRSSRRERRRRVKELIDDVRLAEQHLDRYPYEMSGGQLQRVAIARALATDPELVVCDEPTAALDVSTQAQIVNLLRDLQKERNLTYLFITHDLSLVQVISDEVAVMRLGEIIERSTPQELFVNPLEDYTAELIASIPATHPRNRKFGASRIDRSAPQQLP